MSVLGVPTFCIITGGNGGLGRETAILLAQKFGPGSTMCLVDRDSMEETARSIKNRAGQDIEVRCVKADLSDETSFRESIHSIFDGVEASKYESAIIVHNVMAADMSKYARDLDDVRFIQRCNLVNISGPIVMTAKFINVFTGLSAPGINLRKTIVNITSDAATTPTKTSHVYAMGKAGKDQFFRVMALEEPDVRILTYSPGAMDTEGFKKLKVSADSGMRGLLEQSKHWEGFLKPEQSAAALIKTLEEDNYKNAVVVRSYSVLGILG